MHNLPLTGIYKGIFVQVLAYAWFYKSANFCGYSKSSFCAYVHFRMKSMESFIHEAPGIDCSLLGVGNNIQVNTINW